MTSSAAAMIIKGAGSVMRPTNASFSGTTETPRQRFRSISGAAANGAVAAFSTSPGQLGRPDGIELDEGGGRLLVTSAFASTNRLLAVALSDAKITQLATIDIDEGFFPSGIVYDRLGSVVYRQGDTATSLDAVSIFP